MRSAFTTLPTAWVWTKFTRGIYIFLFTILLLSFDYLLLPFLQEQYRSRLTELTVRSAQANALEEIRRQHQACFQEWDNLRDQLQRLRNDLAEKKVLLNFKRKFRSYFNNSNSTFRINSINSSVLLFYFILSLATKRVRDSNGFTEGADCFVLSLILWRFRKHLFSSI